MFLAFQDAGARDWNSNIAIALSHSGVQDKLQFHHIFPKALLSQHGYAQREIDDIANLAFISGNTNLKILAKPPSVYLAKKRDEIGSEIFHAQCIPTEDRLLDTDNYQVFLAHRRQLIAERLNAFLGTAEESIAPRPVDPYAQDLDRRIEAVELQVRDLVEIQVESNGGMPSHVRDKVSRRMADTRKRDNTATAGEGSLAELLTYSDLRDLQELMASKELWPGFESAFTSKTTLETRFNQLADLRNAIRHSRPLTEVIKKDGEASLAWFGQAIARAADAE
jgi:hypothetical protein